MDHLDGHSGSDASSDSGFDFYATDVPTARTAAAADATTSQDLREDAKPADEDLLDALAVDDDDATSVDQAVTLPIVTEQIEIHPSGSSSPGTAIEKPHPNGDADTQPSEAMSNGVHPETTPDTTGVSLDELQEHRGTEMPSSPKSNTDHADNATDAEASDSSSEMDVSDASSRSPSPEPRINGATITGAKRKMSDMASDATPVTSTTEEPVKKLKLDLPPQDTMPGTPRIAGWPAEMWQHVFLQSSPVVLARCLRVCKAFKSYLTELHATPVRGKKDKTKLVVQDSSAIWIQSRKTYFDKLPKPLNGLTELQMLQLIGGTTCQFCNRPPMSAPAFDQFSNGPGHDGVKVVWPFGIRTCGRCLEYNTLKDIQILQSPVANLRTGLPHAFLTPDLHYVREFVRTLPGGIPGSRRCAKVYFNRDVQNIAQEREDANGYGAAAADEWHKGLVQKGKDAMADAARWEQWERLLPFGASLADKLRDYDLASFPRYAEELHSKSADANGSQQVGLVNGNQPTLQAICYSQNPYTVHGQFVPQQFYPGQRPVRNPLEVEAARAGRKAEIERRCLELEPPLAANVLQHIQAFQAALQITVPLDDHQWEMLKPRILVQREQAELVEHQRAEQLAALQAAIPSIVPDETFQKPAKEVYDREYEQAQEPLRQRLGEYADDYINGQWQGGQSLDRDSVPVFAPEVMLHVRQRYLQDRDAGNLPAPPVQAAKSETSKQSTPAPDPFLSLDNMKWVYDNKIRNLTDNHRRELFICAGCLEDRQPRPKWFAFEGLIQHYGAKHTTAFSKGNIVVHWQTADWPDEPPFHPNPSQWVKAERKFSNFKHQNRGARGTPHANQDYAFPAPSPESLLSNNPLFSNTPQQPPATNGNGYLHGQSTYASPGSQAPSYGRYPSTVPAQPLIDMSEAAQINKVATDAREIWDKLDGVKDMLEPVRMQAVVHHVISRFTDHFRQRPKLDLLTDALAQNSLMRPIKNAHGLACKICVTAQNDGSLARNSYFGRIRDVKLYNASSLITHFKIAHNPNDAAYPDWSRDMIELPEKELVGQLIRQPGMDDEKLGIVDAAFPGVFPKPLPTIGLVTELPPDPGPDTGLASRLIKRLEKKQPAQGKKGKRGQHANGTPREGSEPLPEPAEDEYDPRRPMFPRSKEQDLDPARFDTDIARKASTAPQAAAAFNLDPATLAALNSLNALTGSKHEQPVGRESRSPSVGRANSVGPGQNKPPGVIAAAAPDIAAILASLTGQKPQPTEAVTPPRAVDHRNASAPRSAHTDNYGLPFQQPSPSYVRAGSRQASGQYAPPPQYRASVEPTPRHDGQDLQAALARNTQGFAQNAQPTYVEQPHYAPAPAPQRASPPRYRYVDDYGREVEPPQQQHYRQQSYHETPAVQYVRLEDGAPAPVQYHHPQPQPQPQTVYVDERGRQVELIPIDSAPAPIQYAPHPYEQAQQYARRQEANVYTSAPAAQTGYSAYGQPAYAPQHAAYGQPVYYEQAPAALQQQLRYVAYDDSARSSVPRS